MSLGSEDSGLDFMGFSKATDQIQEKEERRVNDARTRALRRAATNSEGAPRRASYYDALRRQVKAAKSMRETLERLWALAQLAGDSDEDARRLLAALDDIAPEPRGRAERLLKAARHG